MATFAWMAKMRKPQKFAVRFRNRCQVCGRPRGYYRDFGLCRICLRKMAHEGLIPGLRKSSW
ncbi:MAG: type Z 30S ribosomal protein S14 [Elusimicrobiaceae bacterium]|nr:type Z 30S ribosomal protein S14 [Elusimicrobiaceae bacterium]